MLLAIDLDKDFIDIMGVPSTTVFLLESSGVDGPQLDVLADRPPNNDNPGFSQKIFNIAET